MDLLLNLSIHKKEEENNQQKYTKGKKRYIKRKKDKTLTKVKKIKLFMMPPGKAVMKAFSEQRVKETRKMQRRRRVSERKEGRT